MMYIWIYIIILLSLRILQFWSWKIIWFLVIEWFYWYLALLTMLHTQTHAHTVILSNIMYWLGCLIFWYLWLLSSRFCKRSLLHESLDCSLIDKIPGRQTDRKTLLGELNWIFTAVTDTIAWNVLPHGSFYMHFLICFGAPQIYCCIFSFRWSM